VDVTDLSNFRFNSGSEDFTISSWIRTNGTSNTYIVDKRDGDNDGYRLLYAYTVGARIFCSVDSKDIISSSNVNDNLWHNVACSIDRSGNGQIYIDGVADGASVAINNEGMSTTTDLSIGKRSYTALEYFNGSLDDVRIYNRALSASEVAQLYAAGRPGVTGGIYQARTRPKVFTFTSAATPWRYIRRQSQIIGSGLGV